ncbi:hypothetical protein ACHAQJ_001923 [Trichoderma viride]
MKLQIISALSLLFSSATIAAPHPAPATFGIMALRSASPIHFAEVSAARSGLFLNLPLSNATCKGESSGHATFYIANEELSLYSCEGKTQKVFVDRSGMGQGIVGYVTGNQFLPRNGEWKGWSIDANQNLWFKNQGFVACPNSIDGSWRLWLNVGVSKPGGNEGCLGLTARTLEIKKPVSCRYTQ